MCAWRSRLIAREDEDVSAAIKEILEAEGIAVHFGAECIRFEPQGAEIGVGLECGCGRSQSPLDKTVVRYILDAS